MRETSGREYANTVISPPGFCCGKAAGSEPRTLGPCGACIIKDKRQGAVGGLGASLLANCNDENGIAAI